MAQLKDQIILSLEGATYGHSAALVVRGEPFGEIFLNGPRNASETFLASVESLLAQVGMDKRELEGICVGLGPGSFTSIRISLSTAQGLGLALGIPVYGLSTLEAVAMSAAWYPGRVRVAHNAYKGELYLGDYDCSQGRPRPLGELAIVTPEALYESLQPGDLLIGSGVPLLQKKGLDLTQKKILFDNSLLRRPSALLLAQCLLEHPATGESIAPLEPIYIRASEAEINYAKNFGLDHQS